MRKLVLALILLSPTSHAMDADLQARCETVMDWTAKARQLERVGKPSEAYDALWTSFEAFRNTIVPDDLVAALAQFRSQYGWNFRLGDVITQNAADTYQPKTRGGRILVHVREPGNLRYEVRSTAPGYEVQYTIPLEPNTTRHILGDDPEVFYLQDTYQSPSQPTLWRVYWIHDPQPFVLHHGPSPAQLVLRNQGLITQGIRDILGHSATKGWTGVFDREDNDLSENRLIPRRGFLHSTMSRDRRFIGFRTNHELMDVRKTSDLSVVFTLDKNFLEGLLGRVRPSALEFLPTPNGSHWVIFGLGVSGVHGKLAVVDAQGNPIKEIPRVEVLNKKPAISPDGRYLAYVTYNELHIWDLTTRQRVGFHQAELHHLLFPEFSEDSRHLLLRLENTTGRELFLTNHPPSAPVQIFKSSNGERVGEISGLYQVFQSPDGTYLIGPRGSRTYSFHTYDGREVAHFPDGELRWNEQAYPIFADGGNRLLIWRDGRILQELRWRP